MDWIDDINRGSVLCRKEDNRDLSRVLFIAADGLFLSDLFLGGEHSYKKTIEESYRYYEPIVLTQSFLDNCKYFQKINNSTYTVINQPEFICFDVDNGAIVATTVVNREIKQVYYVHELQDMLKWFLNIKFTDEEINTICQNVFLQEARDQENNVQEPM
jgi:hypothetical protein